MKQPILLTLSALLFLTSTHSFAEIYKTVTADGRVVYTDNANTAYQNSNDSNQIKILDNLISQKATPQNNVSTNTSYQPTSSIINQSQYSNTNTPDFSQQGSYQLTMTKPDATTIYRRPQNIDIVVDVKPNLQAGDRLVYRINGKHIATTQNTQYTINSENYEPNQYQLTVEIQNGKGDIIATKNQSFYMLASNHLIREKRKAEAERKARQALYNQLPWYKKIAYNINVK